MRSRGQLAAAVAVAALVVAAGVYVHGVGAQPRDARPVSGPASGAWFCPHGGGSGWDVTLQIANPGPEPVDVRLTRISSEKPRPATELTVSPGAEVRLPFRAGDRASASIVEYFDGWVAAGWVATAGGRESGVAAEPCIDRAARRWFAPDASTVESDDAWVVVMNPFAVDAVVSLSLFTGDRAPIRTGGWTNVPVKPFRSVAFHLNENAEGYAVVGTVVDVPGGRVVVSTLGTSTSGGARSALAQADRAGRAIFPGAADQGRTELLVLNPPETEASVTASLIGGDGPQPIPALQEAPPAGQTAVGFQVTTEGPSAIDVTTSSAVAVARRTFGVSSDQASTAPATAPGTAWLIFPAVGGDPSRPALVLANPSGGSAEVTLSMLTSGGGPPAASVTVTVPARSTVTAPADFVAHDPTAAVLAVASTGTFVPASASYSLGREGLAAYAVALGVSIPRDRVSLQR